MPRGLPHVVREHLEKARAAAVAAVDAYNRPGPKFRTAQYLVLITMAWCAALHAVFYKRGRRPWYREPGKKAVRYVKVEGDPKHWELSECLKQFYGDKNPPERQNLRFLLGLRNKIEHRHLPEMDPALYGECQSALMNLEEFLVGEFGARWALLEQLAVSLQFSRVMPQQKSAALRKLGASSSKSVRDYVERFRGNLPPETLNSTKYSFSVYLVPKVANRVSAADLAVEFIPYDETNPEEMARLEKATAFIKEKLIPVANLDLFRPGQVVEALKKRVPYLVTHHVHASAWKKYGVRPGKGSLAPEKTKQQYCVYDPAHRDYLYTSAWIELLARDLSDPAKYEEVTGSKMAVGVAKGGAS